MSSVGDIGANTGMVCWTVSSVAHYFSNSFLKPAENEYCSKLEKEFSGHIHPKHILFFRVFLGYLNL